MKIFASAVLLISLQASAQQFTEEEVAVGELSGTLSLPSEESDIAILMISGSGPTDRDGNSALGLLNDGLKMVAHSFSDAGYAVLRYDKRGVGKSQKAISNIADHRFEHLVEDAQLWLSFLEEKGYSKIVIAGHSQGSLVGMMAALERSSVKAFISIAGIADDAGTTILQQLGNQSPELAESAKVTMDSIRQGYTAKRYNIMLVSLFGPAVQPFLKSYVPYTPTDEIRKLAIPILIINGTTDLQVLVDDANKLKEAYPKAELLIIEQMNHVLKDAPADPIANSATYRQPELPLSDGLMEGMINFIKNSIN